MTDKEAPGNACDLQSHVAVGLYLRFAQVQFTQVWRAEGAQVKVTVVLMSLADVSRHSAMRVMETPHTCSSILQLHH